MSSAYSGMGDNNLLTKSELEAIEVRHEALTLFKKMYGWIGSPSAHDLKKAHKDRAQLLEHIKDISVDDTQTKRYESHISQLNRKISELEAKLDKEIDFHREVLVKRIKTQTDVLDVVRGLVGEWLTENRNWVDDSTLDGDDCSNELETALKPLENK